MSLRPFLRRLRQSYLAPWLQSQSRDSLAGRLVQRVYDERLNASNETRYRRLKARVINALSQWILRVGDPLVTHRFGTKALALPFSHRLPGILKLYPRYSSNLARLARHVLTKYPNLTLIDIGANIGDSVTLLRQEAEFPILCIEGDEGFASVLERNAALFSEVYTVRAVVGEATESVRLGRRQEGGTARLTRDGILQTLQVKRLSDVLADYPAFLRSKMVKIDTDGFDAKVLRGAAEFLAAARPVVFFEYDPDLLAQQSDDGLAIFKLLDGLGYDDLLIYDNFGDLLLSAAVEDTTRLQEIHRGYSGHNGSRYLDICAFHADDGDLFEQAKEAEVQFFTQLRSRQSDAPVREK